jgi:formylglycine-generating enzyme required for sulfatase activity
VIFFEKWKENAMKRILRPSFRGVLSVFLTVFCVQWFFPEKTTIAARQDRTLKRDAPKTSGAERRVALVIGNSAYARNPLANPVNDAAAMTKALSGVGFDVITRTDVAQREMNRAISQFGAKLSEAGKDAVGLLYYAGHGVQIGGENYLIPIDAEIEREADVATNGVNLNTVLRQMGDAGNRLNIVILDACRDNPFVTRSWRTQSTGLAEIRAASGSFIAFATAPGSVASDGSGKNGLYTEALLGALKRPGIPIESTFKEVLRTVRDRSGGKQLPWTSSLLDGDFYFVPPGSTATNPPENPTKPGDTGTKPPVSPPPVVTSGPPPKAGATIKLGVPGFSMTYIPAGTFKMGTQNASDERPVHDVEIRSPFWMGTYEVTQAQWESVMGNNPSRNKGCADCGSRPVEFVSWDDCQLFLRRLNERKDGYRYDLPTEAEWEYAARAGVTKNLVSLTPGFLEPFAWHQDNAGGAAHPVGLKSPNTFGLYDMHGNVAEWCRDWYHDDYTDAPNDGSAWESPPGRQRVLRGGSWLHIETSCRFTFRIRGNPDGRYEGCGLRLVARPVS